jgi:hypothetical protein
MLELEMVKTPLLLVNVGVLQVLIIEDICSSDSIVETAVSTSARTFLPTSGGQSLIVDLIKARVTGVKGYCDEPLLQAVASPTVLFDRCTSGWTLAESFYAASRFVGWEDIAIGDPLCSPYAIK